MCKNRKLLIIVLSILMCMKSFEAAALTVHVYFPDHAKEYTQLANKLQLIDQLREQIQMVQNQFKMLQQLSGGMLSQLTGVGDDIMSQFTQIQDVWKQTTSLTHAMDDFADIHRNRHQEQSPETQVNVENERQRRDREWRDMADAYLTGISMNAQDLENSQRSREKMASVLQSTEGQVQAIQALGSFINHTSQIVEQNGQIASAFLTMYAENELDKRALDDNASKNLGLAFNNARNVQPTGKGYNPKPQW